MEAASLFPPYTSWESDSGYKVWQQASLHVSCSLRYSVTRYVAEAGLELLLSCLYFLRTAIAGM